MRLIAVLFTVATALHINTGFASVKSFFNHNQSNSYTDPYRKISRPGDNLEAVVLVEINKAKKSIFVAVQELRLPLIAEALIKKQKEGVDVRVVLENSYNFDTAHQRDTSESEHEASRVTELRAFVDINRNNRIEEKEQETRDAIYMLKKAKIKIMDDTFGGGMGSALMHHKFVVIDEKVTIVSTANFTMSCIHGDVLVAGSKGNANSMMVINSAPVADAFVEEFTELWGNGQIGAFGLRKRYRAPKTFTMAGVKLTVQFSPTSKNRQFADTVNGLISRTLNKANRSIKASLFVFSDQQIANALEPKFNSGVEIGVMIEKMFAYRPYSELLDMMNLELADEDCLKDPGNRLWKKPIKEGGMSILSPGDINHHKYAVVDERIVIMGSQNWTESANYANDETLIVVENTTIAGAYGKEYNRVKSESVIGAPEYLLRKIKDNNARCARMR